MKFFIKKCAICGMYTLKEFHCNSKVVCPHPIKYSPLDKYAKYRRKGRENEE
jgi:rRNA maturation protein Nop10